MPKRSERKRRLTDKAKENLRQREEKEAIAKARKKVKKKSTGELDGGIVAGVAPPDEEECPICLGPPVHPVQLECSHKYCFVCAKVLDQIHI